MIPLAWANGAWPRYSANTSALPISFHSIGPVLLSTYQQHIQASSKLERLECPKQAAITDIIKAIAMVR